MAMQTTFKKLVSGCYEKLVPGLLLASRKSHISASHLRSPHHARNFVCSMQSPSMEKAKVSDLLKEKELNLLFSPAQQGQFLDLDLLNSVHKRVYMPSTLVNKVKIYEDKHYGIIQTVTDPLLKDCEIVHVPVPGQPTKKEAHRMINIRRKKMKKHQRKKLYKRMRFVWEKLWRKREIRKETDFRYELLTQIDEAKLFDAEKYVHGVLDKIRYHKKPPTLEEKREQYRLLIKKNRGNSMFIMPKFDDDDD